MIDEAGVRVAAFAGVAAALVALESLRATRARPSGRRAVRALRHLGLAGAGLLAARMALPIGVVGVAAWAQGAGVGLFNLDALAGAPGVGVAVACLIALDLAIYLQHRAMHRIPALWRLHRVHHADVEMDLTTALRFHPLEIAVSALWKAVVVLALGVPPAVAATYEIVLSAMALFNHANIRLPARVEGPLRAVIATPAFHLVHHSPRPAETDSNFANALTIWDRLFGTWRDTAAAPDPGLGLDRFRDAPDQSVRALLLQPFRR